MNDKGTRVPVEESELFRQLVKRYSELGEVEDVVRFDLQRLVDWALRLRAERAEARAAELEALAHLVRKRCREAVPQWAPEIRESLARLDAERSTER